MWRSHPVILTVFGNDYLVSAKLSAYITDMENT